MDLDSSFTLPARIQLLPFLARHQILYKQNERIEFHMTRISETISLIVLLYLILANVALCDQYGAIRFDDNGAFSIEVHGAPTVRGSLFLWYGEWKYTTPSGVEPIGQDSWRGTMPEPGVTDGYISYTQTVKSTPDGGADVALHFRKNATSTSDAEFSC